MKYIETFGLWWPDIEPKTDELFGYMLRRVTDIDVAVKKCRTVGVCVQAGGFIGMWPRRLAKFFEYVFTFEPSFEHYEVLKKNTAHLPSVIATNAALAAKSGTIKMDIKSGGRTCTSAVGIEVDAIAIDDMNLPRCDAIFLDVERGELEALKGAEQTIEQWKPVITVEFKKETDDPQTAWLVKRGYSIAETVHGDRVYVPKLK